MIDNMSICLIDETEAAGEAKSHVDRVDRTVQGSIDVELLELNRHIHGYRHVR
jgi:hypothetical protein